MDLWFNKGNRNAKEEGQEILLTLFVGAIGSEATVESITNYFEGFGKVSKVKIILDWVTKQSKECALVYFTSHDSVRKVLKFPKHIIGDRVVRVEPADRTKKGTKIIDATAVHVSNIHHLALHAEVIEYFSTFGQITSCKFSKDRTVDGKTKSATIRYEKQYSIDRVLAMSTGHVVGGRSVICSLLKNSIDAGMEEDLEPFYPHRSPGYLPAPTFHAIDPHHIHGHYEPDVDHDKQFWQTGPNFTNQDFQYVENHGATYYHHEFRQENQDNYKVHENYLDPSDRVKSFGPKPQYILFPSEYQKDQLYTIFCDCEIPSPSNKIRWEDTPYSKKLSKRSKNCY